VLPGLERRLEALLGRLARQMPHGEPLVPAHGDFHADQLLVQAGGLAVIDFDGLCLASPALDLATYTADVVRGRDGDMAAVEALQDALLRGYDGCPAGLRWHLATAILGRAAHPFQRQVPAWPERVEAMVAITEEALFTPCAPS
jgi:aminoglycoside phosphotransferase (APT) family kinase protein